MLTARETYALFLGLRNHFATTSYDFTKFGVAKISLATFNSRKDKYVFEKLANTYRIPELKAFFIANLLINPKIWSMSLLENDAKTIYINHQKHIQALSYNFEQELQKLINEQSDPRQWFKGLSPIIFTLYLQKDISIETLIILNNFIPFKKLLDARLENDFLWPETSVLMEKYSKLFQYDHEKIKGILLNNLTPLL